MHFLLQPWQLYLTVLAGWMNREQQQVIEYLRTENQVLREKLGKQRILLSDGQRRRLGAKGRILGRKLLGEITTLFTPDTILRWHRELVAQKWNYADRKQGQPGRPRIHQEIVDLVLKMARENPTWGYGRIQGALSNLGYQVCESTIANILKAHGVEPAPGRKRTGSWRTFLNAHWDVLAAADFTTVEVWTRSGLVTFYLLFVMELKTRQVELAGITTSPNELWMKQIAKNLTDLEGFLLGKEHLLIDRDTKFCPAFQETLRREGITPQLLPPRSPNLNAQIERFMRSLKEECLNRMIFFGEASLHQAVDQYLEHYHTERNHQGMQNKLLRPDPNIGSNDDTINRRERLGGLLSYYQREAA